MIDTIWSNIEFGLASNIAKNPALAAIWKVTDLIQENTGGINVPFISAMGTGFDLNTTIENLVKLGVVGTSSLGMIGDLISGISSTFMPSSMLWKLGITSGLASVSRGTGLGGRAAGLSTSTSVVTKSTSSGEDISQGALAGAQDNAREEVKGQQEEQENPADTIKAYLIDSFDTKLDRLIGYVEDLRNTVVDGEVKTSISFDTLGNGLLF